MLKLAALFLFLINPTALLAAPESLNFSTSQKEWLVRNQTVPVGVDPNWRPIEFIENAQLYGFSNDLLDILGESIGITFVKVPVNNYQKMQEMLDSGTVKMFSSVIRTDERLNFLRFTDSYASIPIAICVRRDFQGGVNFRSLQQPVETENGPVKRKVAIVSGYALSEFLKADYLDIEFVERSSVIEAIDAVKSGDAEAYVDAYPIINYHLDSEKYRDLKFKRNDTYTMKLRFGVMSENVALLQILQKALDNMGADAKVALERKWLGRQWFEYHTLLKLGLLVVLVLVFIYLFILKNEKYR
ncbi:MAG: transporter substrate-binding domain-containing protein [Pseudomonadales bacterium]|nr:transporter substrate-binding domain-containing protein [Pseudomonadales bacterium]